ncbi:MAG: serine/threonine protein kinase [Archangium sp.]|nr:serine/threonine protein kinase [Archangium sp.]
MSVTGENPGFEPDNTSVRPDTTSSLARFGKYALVGPIARGGMAEVTLAVQEGEGVQGFSKVVALKRVLASQSEERAFVQMFLDEARLAARLDHPNIVRIYDVGHFDGRFFLAMEYLPGEDLQRLMQLCDLTGAAVDPDIAAALISSCAEGLHFAHELTDDNGVTVGLVHRDISPSNIIVTHYGHTKIVDFGIAKAASNSFRTEAGVMKGKAAYFAPEQVSRGPLDRRCDVYSLGIVLWELLVGQRLYLRESHAATLAAAAMGEVTEVRAHRPDVEPALEAIVMKALQRDPNERYQTSMELHEALEEYLATRARPGTKDIAAWVQTLAGERRATLKRSIARGINLLRSLDELRDLDESMARPTTSGSRLPAVASKVMGAGPRPLWQVATFGAAAAAVVAVGALLPLHGPAATPIARGATLTVTSEPTGAMVFIGGEPTGRLTPTTLADLPAGSPLEVSVKRPGHRPAQATVTLSRDSATEKRFDLGSVSP